MSRRMWIITAVVVVVLLVAVGVPAGLVLRSHQQTKAQQAAAERFAHAWQSGGLSTISYANAQAASVNTEVQKITSGLTTAAKDAPAKVSVESVSKVSGDKNAVSARLQVAWKISTSTLWTYSSSLKLIHKNGDWLPDYTPSVIHPKLTAGAVLRTSSEQAKRGEIIGANDDPLVTDRDVVTVGFQRSRADDVESSVTSVAAITGVDGAALLKRVKAAGKDTFVQVITLRKDAYDELEESLRPIPGTVFQNTTLSLGPTPEFAQALLGRVGPATAEIVKAAKGRVRAGDITGLSGLQRTYDEQLSGRSGLSVKVIGATGAKVRSQTLFSIPAVAGKPVKISLDRKIQQAAEEALKSAKKPAALVAIKVGTGEVLAVGNGGPNAAGYNRAFLGRYPPGSTFKVVSGFGLLGAGVTPQTTIQCPASINIGGRNFTNAEDEELGAVSFHTDFANSCNTAFIGSAKKLSISALSKAARTLGYGQPNQLGVGAFTGSVPTSGDSVAHAASMIGQGTVLASPVTVAGASAAVAAGRWTAPRLVLDGTPDSDSGVTAPAGTPTKGTALSAQQDSDLKKMMRSVVTDGTATNLRSTPGGPLYGKTGTAEFGNDDPPHTHAWFTGFQGDIAFACVVEDGGFGAKAAGPIVKDFLTRLAQ